MNIKTKISIISNLPVLIFLISIVLLFIMTLNYNKYPLWCYGVILLLDGISFALREAYLFGYERLSYTYYDKLPSIIKNHARYYLDCVKVKRYYILLYM